jgi:hypothetical protein
MRYKLVQAASLVTLFWWSLFTVYGLFTGAWGSWNELAWYMSETVLWIATGVTAGVGTALTAYLLLRWTTGNFLKGRGVRGLNSTLGPPPLPPYHIPTAAKLHAPIAPAVEAWLASLKALHPEHYRLASKILRILSSDPRMPASHVKGGHGGKTLWEHSQLVCQQALEMAPAWSYTGLTTAKGDLVTALRDTNYRFNVVDPLIGIVALAHDIGKLKTFVRDEQTGEVVKETHEHDSVSALMLSKLDEFWCIPRVDQEAILGAVGFYHRPQSFPLDKGQRAYDDRTHALMELLIAADRAAGQIESGINPIVAGGQQSAEFLANLWNAFRELASEPGRINSTNKVQSIGQKRGDIAVFKEQELRRLLAQKLAIQPSAALESALLEVLAEQGVLYDPNPSMRASANSLPNLRTYSVSFFNGNNGKHLATWNKCIVIMPRHVLPCVSSLLDHPARFEVHIDEVASDEIQVTQELSPAEIGEPPDHDEPKQEPIMLPLAPSETSDEVDVVLPVQTEASLVSDVLSGFIGQDPVAHDEDHGAVGENALPSPNHAPSNPQQSDVLDDGPLFELGKRIEVEAEETALRIVQQEDEAEKERLKGQLKKISAKDKNNLKGFEVPIPPDTPEDFKVFILSQVQSGNIIPFAIKTTDPETFERYWFKFHLIGPYLPLSWNSFQNGDEPLIASVKNKDGRVGLLGLRLN